MLLDENTRRREGTHHTEPKRTQGEDDHVAIGVEALFNQECRKTKIKSVTKDQADERKSPRAANENSKEKT